MVAGLVVYVASRKQQLQKDRRAAELQEQERQRAAELREQERRRDEEARKLAELERERVDFLAEPLRALDEIQKLGRFIALLEASAPHVEAPSARYRAFVQWVKLRLTAFNFRVAAESI